MWLYKGRTCFVVTFSLPLSLPFDWTFKIWSMCLLFSFVCFEWMLCCDVVCEKNNKMLITKKKEPQNCIYCLNFSQIGKIWKLKPCFIPELTCSLFLVAVLSISSLLRNVFFTCNVYQRGGVYPDETEGKREKTWGYSYSRSASRSMSLYSCLHQHNLLTHMWNSEYITGNKTLW